jgi:glycosyltransferase involved in cell wall biosynthesis
MDPGSRYCKFICADDWIYPECLEKMVAVAERNPTVGFVSSYRLIGDCLEHDGLLPYTQELMSGREAMRRAIRDGIYVTGSQTQLLYRSEIVRSVKPFFDETTWLADTDAALRTLQRADLGFVHQVLTYTRVHPATITSATTNRLHTYIPFHIGVLIRYGAGVLSPQDYRRLLRSRLRLYWWFLFKQGLKPSRRRDKAFQAFHNTQILRLLSELDRGDRETRLALQSMRMLLAGRITVADLSGEHGKASPEELREHASRMQSQIESAVHSKQS